MRIIHPSSLLPIFAALILMTTISARAAGTNLRLMPLGDSITRGFKSSSDDGYRGPLYKALVDEGNVLDFVGSQRSGAMFDPDVEGYNGYRIDQIAALVNEKLTTYHPNLITLHIGTNDIGQSYQVSTAPQRLASLIDQILAVDPKITIIVAQLICNATPAIQALTDAYNSKIPAIIAERAKAGKHVSMVSMSALTPADLADGLHPNDDGYQKMAEAWNAAIQRVIADGWVAPIEFAGVFEIQNVASGMAVDVSDASRENGGKVVQWPYGENSNQKWNFIPTGSGYYQIKNAYSGLDLNVTGSSKNAGAPIVQWQFGSEGNDQWLPARQADGAYTFTNRNSGLALDNTGSSTQGAQFIQAEVKDSDSQKFKLIQH